MRANRSLRRAPTWGCGRLNQTPRMEYTATAFAEPLRRIFAELYRPTEDLSIDYHPESRYFVHAIEYRSEIRRRVEDIFYEPVVRSVRAVATRVRRLQAGLVHLYLLYLTVALIAAAVAALWW
jgi:hypothetical protein